MKLLKYIFFTIILISCIFFIIKLDQLNTVNQEPIKIKIPYISAIDPSNDGIKVWEAILLSVSMGVFIGFLIALYQIISQTSEIMSLKSKIRRLNHELDNLRNQSIDDDIDIKDEISMEEDL
ncbi:MAG: hypothetical protein CMG14_07095 [Candidatus Marinimicrobia bacterium]|nr:hypothetical protein [Candidatus Neomarinimicrobiota bacterium]